MAVRFGVADFITGRVIATLPVMGGASWAVMLNKADALSCSIDLRDPGARALDIMSITEPLKHVLFAETEYGDILAWGQIGEDREYDADDRVLTLHAEGGWSYFDNLATLNASAAGAQLTVGGVPQSQYDSQFLGSTLSGLVARFVRQALEWPGSPTTFVVPADEAGSSRRQYAAIDLKPVGEVLSDLTEVEGGPDIAFDARYRSDGRTLEFPVRIGRGSNPLLGSNVGEWGYGGDQSVVSKLKLTGRESLATDVFMVAGKSQSTTLSSHALNRSLSTMQGYPPRHLIDTSRTNVNEQDTLDAYAREQQAYASRSARELSFTVRADATPALGQYRPGDAVSLVIGRGDPVISERTILVRITGFSGNEVSDEVPITCSIISETIG